MKALTISQPYASLIADGFKWCGSVPSYVARQAAKFFVAEKSAAEVCYQIGSESYRVSKF